MKYGDYVDEDRRLVILRLLREAGGHGNESVLETGLNALGHRREMTRDHVREYLRWLEERGAVTIEMVKETVMVASLTDRGLKCAKGAIQIEGVKRPEIIE